MSSLRRIWMLFVCIGFISVNSCIEKSRQELIIGSWKLDQEKIPTATDKDSDFHIPDMKITFFKDHTLVSEVSIDGKKYEKADGSYTFKHDGKYIVILIGSSRDSTAMEILELSNTTLKLVGPDSKATSFKKINNPLP